MEAERGSKSYYRPFESRVHVPRWRALLCLAIGLAGCDRTASRGRLDLDSIGIRVGTAGLVAPGRWNFVYVTARASSGVFQGRVRIRGLDRRTELTWG